MKSPPQGFDVRKICYPFTSMTRLLSPRKLFPKHNFQKNWEKAYTQLSTRSFKSLFVSREVILCKCSALVRSTSQTPIPHLISVAYTKLAYLMYGMLLLSSIGRLNDKKRNLVGRTLEDIEISERPLDENDESCMNLHKCASPTHKTCLVG